MPPSVRQSCPAAVAAAAEEPPSVSKRMSSSQLRSSPKASARETKKLPAAPETAPFPLPAMRRQAPAKPPPLAALAAAKRKKAIRLSVLETPEISPPQTAPEIRIRLLHLLPFLPPTEPAQREPLLPLWRGRFFVFQALRVCGAVLLTPASFFQARDFF